MLQVLEYLEEQLEETGQYPKIEDVPTELRTLIFSNPIAVNNLLLSANLPTYYQPPALASGNKPLEPALPVGSFITNPNEELLGVSDRAMKQKMAIKLMTNIEDKRSTKAKLTSINVTTQEYNQWLKNPVFLRKLSQAIDKRFANTKLDAKIGLMRLVTDGDLGAIRYFHEFTGEFKAENETVLNLTKILAVLMEVLVKYVDPSVMPEIADAIETRVLGVSKD